MGYTVKPDGSIVAGSLVEALAVSRALAGMKEKKEKGRRGRIRSPEREREQRPANGKNPLGANARRLVGAVVKSAKKGLAPDQMVHDAGLRSTRQLAFILSGIRRSIEARVPGTSESVFWKEEGRWFGNEEKLREIGLLEAKP